MVESLCPGLSIQLNDSHNQNRTDHYPVRKISLKDSRDAKRLSQRMNGVAFYGRWLSVRIGMNKGETEKGNKKEENFYWVYLAIVVWMGVPTVCL